jgi:hypothetical protein
MKTVVLTIPDDPAQAAAWLERQLVGLELRRLVAELAAVHGGPRPGGTTLPVLLKDHVRGVCEGGLARLPRDVLQQLLTQPALLLELQDLVLTRGGDYWDGVARSSEAVRERVEKGRELLTAGRGASRPAKQSSAPSVIRVPWHRRPWVVSLTTAAAVLLVVAGGYQAYQAWNPPSSVPTPAPGWGWSRPDALPQGLDRSAYLGRLADAAEEWFNKRPEDAPGVARRIGEFRQGCSVLLLAEHPSLPPEDRAWLLERCRTWAAKLDQHLIVLEAVRTRSKCAPQPTTPSTGSSPPSGSAPGPPDGCANDCR